MCSHPLRAATRDQKSRLKHQECVLDKAMMGGMCWLPKLSLGKKMDSSTGCSWPGMESLGKCLEAAAFQAGLTQGTKHLQQVEVKHHENGFHRQIAPWS